MTQLCGCGCGEPAPVIKMSDARKGWIKGQFAKYIAGHYQKMSLMAKAGQTPMLVQRAAPEEQEITEQDIVNLRIVDDNDAAELYDNRLIVLERMTKRSFLEVGMICLEVTRRDLWKCRIDPATGSYFHSRDAWMAARLNVSRRSAYYAMEVLSAKDVPLKDLQEMPRSNAIRLAGMSSAVQRDPKIVEAAKGSEKGFVTVVNASYPDQHQEPRRAVMVTLPDSAREAMDECFGAVRWAYDVEKREDILETLFAYFMDGRCEREGFTNWTNREAFEAAKKRGVQ